MTTYAIIDADSRSGTVLLVEGASRTPISLSEIQRAAEGRDEAADVWREIAQRLHAALRADAHRRVHNCPGHRAKTSEERPFTGAANPYDQHVAAHGHLTLVETCDCGATRDTNVNGRHREEGIWRA